VVKKVHDEKFDNVSSSDKDFEVLKIQVDMMSNSADMIEYIAKKNLQKNLNNSKIFVEHEMT